MERTVVIRLLFYGLMIAMVCVVMESDNTIQLNRLSEMFGDQEIHTSDFLSKPAEEMTEADIIRYIRFTNSTSCRITQGLGGKMLKVNGRVGMDGQRPVCLDLGVLPRPGLCIVYTTNNGESSFYKAFEEYGCNVFVFDHFNKEDEDQSPHLHMINFNIGIKDSDESGKKIRTLASAYKTLSKRLDHNDVDIDYVKLDIEGTEWEVIPQIIKSGILDRVKQLNIEMHYGNDTLPAMHYYVGIIKSLEAAGMVRYSNRPNIFWTGKFFGVKDYFIQEMAWYNQKFFFE